MSLSAGTTTQDVLNLVHSGSVHYVNLDRYAVSRLVPIAVFRPFRCFPRLNAEREYEKTRVFSPDPSCLKLLAKKTRTINTI